MPCEKTISLFFTYISRDNELTGGRLSVIVATPIEESNEVSTRSWLWEAEAVVDNDRAQKAVIRRAIGREHRSMSIQMFPSMWMFKGKL